MTQQTVFVYFKAGQGVREAVMAATLESSSRLAAQSGCQVRCARRVSDSPGQEQTTSNDTWLEQYDCPDDASASTLLTALSSLSFDHRLVALTIEGLAGRHLEHFISIDSTRTALTPAP